MIDNREIIRESATQDEWEAFSDKVEMLTDKELVELADRLGVTVESNANWQDYRDEFENQTWRDFTYYYEKVNGGTY